ncbi:Hpt domain-containing protein [Methyloraptor flagellatus]|uniref:Hpt domain-containing protein n=1 Tax=Methyloraptor flagellatus TaxID=3162530 RepID=A0AAU7XB84_9HYPH
MGTLASTAVEAVAPVDLAHLAAATFGDVALEREVLVLFLSQSAELIGRIAGVPDGQGRSELAHRLKGAAAGIGARAVAEAADRVEAGGDPGALCRLAEAVAEAQAFIHARLDQAR